MGPLEDKKDAWVAEKKCSGCLKSGRAVLSELWK